VLSPCVTFNDHDGSTKSYSYVKDHDEPPEQLSFVPFFEDISVDYALLEPRSAKGEGKSGIVCIPASFDWNDLGSWAALYEHRSAGMNDGANVIDSPHSFTLNAQGNFIHSKKKFVAAVGVSNLVVVETDDALLITTRENSQDVGKVVKYLDEKKLERLV